MNPTSPWSFWKNASVVSASQVSTTQMHSSYLYMTDKLSASDRVNSSSFPVSAGVTGIELKHLCLEYMTPWLRNLVRFCKHNDDAKRQRVTAILDKLITMTINEKQMYPSIQAKIWGSLGQVGLPLCTDFLSPSAEVLQNPGPVYIHQLHKCSKPDLCFALFLFLDI